LFFVVFDIFVVIIVTIIIVTEIVFVLIIVVVSVTHKTTCSPYSYGQRGCDREFKHNRH
jgi:hypothetical protein